jgi:CRISPR/Cas system-associated endonuclease/helicase Cas3
MNGKLILRYIGSPNYCHTELKIKNNDKYSFCIDKSLGMIIWIICDIENISKQQLLLYSNTYSYHPFFDTFYKDLFSINIDSKYDILYNNNAVADNYAYLLSKLPSKKINFILSLLKFIRYSIINEYKIDNLHIIYSFDEREIHEHI